MLPELVHTSWLSIMRKFYLHAIREGCVYSKETGKQFPSLVAD
jgi:hypothetical protein